jgi:hypothetical protein
MSSRRTIVLLCTVLLDAAVCISHAAEEPPDKSPAAAPSRGLAADWKKDVDVPEARDDAGQLMFPATKLKLWVEQGWLVARYETPDRGLEWQVVLAQASDPKEPEIRFDKPAGFELKYGPYFIREYIGHLRLLRERKTNDSPPWPEIPIDRRRKPSPTMKSATGLAITDYEVGGWRWLVCGSIDAQHEAPRNDLCMRVQHELEPPRDPNARKGVSGRGFGVFHVLQVGPYIAHDEGDLFIGERSMVSEDQIRHEIADVLNGRPAPDLKVARWYNESQLPPGTIGPAGMPGRLIDLRFQAQLGRGPAPPRGLNGKAVLLYFWTGNSYDPAAAALQDKFKDRGLVVISVHPDRDVGDINAMIKDRRVELPIAIDPILNRGGGQAETAYSVKIWPTYFLIDKEGKVCQGFLEHPPTDKQVEELLK